MAEYRFALFVAGNGPRSAAVEANVRSFCDAHLTGGYELEIVDVVTAPETAEEHKILATPTLIRFDPPPPIRLIGDISETNRVRTVLGLSGA